MAIRGIKRFKKIIRSIKKSDVKTIDQQKIRIYKLKTNPKKIQNRECFPRFLLERYARY